MTTTSSRGDVGRPAGVLSRRDFLRTAAAAAAWTITPPWLAPWAHVGVSGVVRQYDAAVPDAHAQVLLRLIESTPGFTPPVASRAIAYFGVALYESLVPGMRGYRSLHGILPGFPDTPMTPGSSLHWPTVANYALGGVINALFPSNAPMIGMVGALIKDIDATFAIPKPVRDRSADRGTNIAGIVADWAASDGGHEGYTRNFPAGYVPVSGPGLWVPTPPAFQPIPLQPFWGANREFVDAGCVAPPPPEYSIDADSTFFRFAMEVHDTSLTLTAEQAEIALFWADDPGTVTPPGHSFSMLRQVLAAEDESLERAAEAYLRVGCTIADAFIQCWRTKYIWNLLRPVTFIRATVDPAWNTLVTTPPFPEYSSGHSAQSGAWAEAMTSFFGDGYGFTDHTHDEAGLTPRSFTSFHHAAAETAVSRLYGGIHYRFGNENGLDSGVCIGRKAADLPLQA